MEAETLSITLPAELARLIHRQVESGAYASDSEVVREALRVWQDRESERRQALDAVRAKLEQAAGDPRRVSDDAVGRHFDARLRAIETAGRE